MREAVGNASASLSAQVGGAGRCFLKARGQSLKLSWIVLRDVGGDCRRNWEVS